MATRAWLEWRRWLDAIVVGVAAPLALPVVVVPRLAAHGRLLRAFGQRVTARERVRAALGSSFALRSFHDVVLTGGALPLGLLGRRIDRWIAATR